MKGYRMKEINNTLTLGGIIPSNSNPNPIVITDNTDHKDILKTLKSIETLLEKLPEEIAKKIHEINQ
jgi:hypothetical protein